MIKGQCLCGEIAYTYNGQLDEVVICHCNQCKQAQGTPFATNAPVNASLFELEKGEDYLQRYYSSPNKQRAFCKQCGSPLYSKRDDKPDVLRLRLGTVTQGHIPQPRYEIYCESQSDWLKPNSERQKFQQNIL